MLRLAFQATYLRLEILTWAQRPLALSGGGYQRRDNQLEIYYVEHAEPHLAGVHNES